MRPLGTFKLESEEKDALTWYVLSGCSKAAAFGAFVRPSLIVSRPTLEKAAQQFFAGKEAIAYMEAYKQTLEKFASPEEKKPVLLTAEERKKRKEEALQRLMDYVVERSMNIESVDNVEDIIKFADKLGLLGDGGEVIEAPRRYLPETCSSCRYRRFVEDNCIDD